MPLILSKINYFVLEEHHTFDVTLDLTSPSLFVCQEEVCSKSAFPHSFEVACILIRILWNLIYVCTRAKKITRNEVKSQGKCPFSFLTLYRYGWASKMKLDLLKHKKYIADLPLCYSEKVKWDFVWNFLEIVNYNLCSLVKAKISSSSTHRVIIMTWLKQRMLLLFLPRSERQCFLWDKLKLTSNVSYSLIFCCKLSLYVKHSLNIWKTVIFFAFTVYPWEIFDTKILLNTLSVMVMIGAAQGLFRFFFCYENQVYKELLLGEERCVSTEKLNQRLDVSNWSRGEMLEE
jgi:hypothetical protein